MKIWVVYLCPIRINFMEMPSRFLEQAVDQITQLPGIGRRTALRLVLHLLREDPAKRVRLSEALGQLEHIRRCVNCNNLSDSETCAICSSARRDRSLICIVEDIMDVMAIENTGEYNGLYHVLGGKISPLEGIGPSELSIDRLMERLRSEGVEEVIFALSATMEGDTTNFYIFRQLGDLELKTSSIARGVSVGDELQYADEITLGRSIRQRVPFDGVSGSTI